MATFFGEVLPIVSRAVEDDGDDESEVSFNVKVESLSQCPSKVDCVLLVVGRTASIFAKGHILGVKKLENQNSVFLVKSEQKSNDDQFESGLDYRKEKTLLLSAIPHPNVENVLVLVCEDDIKPELVFNTVCEVFQHSKITSSTQIIVLTTINWVNYKSSLNLEYESFPISRILANSFFPESNVKSQVALESPNFLTGMAAATLSHSEICEVPAAALIAYENESTSLSLDIFRQLFLSSTFLKKFITVTDQIKVQSDLVDHGYLYL